MSKIGLMVRLKTPMLGNPAGVIGYVFNEYPDFDEPGDVGVQVIFPNGNYDGFSVEEQGRYLEPIRVNPLYAEFEFTNVVNVHKNFLAGYWDFSRLAGDSGRCTSAMDDAISFAYEKMGSPAQENMIDQAKDELAVLRTDFTRVTEENKKLSTFCESIGDKHRALLYERRDWLEEKRLLRGALEQCAEYLKDGCPEELDVLIRSTLEATREKTERPERAPEDYIREQKEMKGDA